MSFFPYIICADTGHHLTKGRTFRTRRAALRFGLYVGWAWNPNYRGSRIPKIAKSDDPPNTTLAKAIADYDRYIEDLGRKVTRGRHEGNRILATQMLTEHRKRKLKFRRS